MRLPYGLIFTHMTTGFIISVYLAIFFFAIIPFILAVLADAIGNWLGCNINEGGTDPCIRWGVDFGRVLYPMFVMGWLTLMTIPIATVLGIGFTVYLLL